MILATNSPNSELVITILIDEVSFVNKKTQKNALFLNILIIDAYFYILFVKIVKKIREKV